MTTARHGQSANVLPSGKVLVAGGEETGSSQPPSPLNGIYIASADLFDPTGNAGAGTFATTGSMATARGYHTASVLLSGNVLVAGGVGGNQAAFTLLASAELLTFVPAGRACTAGAECVSGICADGVCCDAACNGGCDRCDLPSKEGTCSVVPAGNPGANPTCAVPYACDGVNAACPTSCASNAACATTFVCNVAKATCGPATSTCYGDHTTTGADGKKQDCAPYKCDSTGACRATCTSVNDCVAPTLCDSTGKCVAPPPDTASSGGCATSAVHGGAGDSSPRLAWFAVAVGLVLVRRRRGNVHKTRTEQGQTIDAAGNWRDASERSTLSSPERSRSPSTTRPSRTTSRTAGTPRAR